MGSSDDDGQFENSFGGASGVTSTYPATGEQMNPDDTFKILVASDIHLGFAEGDSNREDDSFNTFEEILEIAKEEDVDFVLLGGDLFHENKPKPGTLKRAMDILRKYCFGTKPVQFEYMGDPKRDFLGLEDPEVNYYSPFINIALPVFTIHGNHDDPTGSKKTSAVDHLSAAKLLNHFGQFQDLNHVDVSPVLLRKGDSHIALYGLGNVKDERLFRLFRDEKVKFVREESDPEKWFNIFVLHQNRVKHGTTNYIPTNYLPSFLHLAIWGHEHECRIEPELTPIGALDKGMDENTCHISQPGSSVATSLAPGESVEKFVGVLFVNKKLFKLEKKKLKTVRPFLTEDIYTSEVFKGNTGVIKEPQKYLQTYVEAKVKDMVENAADLLTGHEKQPVNPLIRVRIGYDDESELFNAVQFSQKFASSVANDDIILFKKCPKKKDGQNRDLDLGDLDDVIMADESHDLEGHVEEIVENFFKEARLNNENDKILEILSEKGLSEGVKSCVEVNDKEAIGAIVDHQISEVIEFLKRRDVTDDTIEEELESLRASRSTREDQDVSEARRVLASLSSQNSRSQGGRGRGRGASTSRGSRRQTSDDDDDDGDSSFNRNDDEDDDMHPEITIDDDSDDDMPPPPTTGRGGRARGGRGSRGGRSRGATPAARSRGSSSRGTTRARGRSRTSTGGF